MKRTSATGSTGRMISVSGKFVKAQHCQRTDKENDRLHGQQHPLADKHPQLFDIVSGADHQLGRYGCGHDN